MILTPSQKLHKNGEDLGKIIVANGFKRLPKVQNIAQSSHTECEPISHSLVTERKSNVNEMVSFNSDYSLFVQGDVVQTICSKCLANMIEKDVLEKSTETYRRRDRD